MVERSPIEVAFKRLVVANVLLFLVFAALAGYVFYVNNNRISEIQHSRVISCERSYEGIREVFKPFFRPVKQRTPKEKHDLTKFNRIIDHRKASCASQVGVT